MHNAQKSHISPVLVSAFAAAACALGAAQAHAATVTFDRPTFEANVGTIQTESFEDVPATGRNTTSALAFPLFTLVDNAPGSDQLGVVNSSQLTSATPSDGSQAVIFDPAANGDSVTFDFTSAPIDGFGITIIDLEDTNVRFTLADNTEGVAAVAAGNNDRQFFGVFSDGGPEIMTVTFTALGGDPFLFDEALVAVPSPAAAAGGLAMFGLTTLRRRGPAA